MRNPRTPLTREQSLYKMQRMMLNNIASAERLIAELRDQTKIERQIASLEREIEGYKRVYLLTYGKAVAGVAAGKLSLEALEGRANV